MIQVRNLTRYYGGFAALKDVSFEVKSGEIIGLLGLNGAGKSTTLKILAGILSPSEGSVTLHGQDVTEDADVLKAKIGFLPEEPPLYRDMKVDEFLVYCATLKGMSAADARAKLPAVLRDTGLTDRAKQVIGTLSHGYKKRVGIAMAVIHDPDLVILDEPISGLDPKQIAELRGVIRSLAEDRAVLLSSHILSEISRTCDRVLLLKDGQLLHAAAPHELVVESETTALLVTVRGDAEALNAWLSDQSAVKEFATRAAEPSGCVQVALTLDQEVHETFLADLISAGFGLRLVEQNTSNDLENVFLNLTRGD